MQRSSPPILCPKYLPSRSATLRGRLPGRGGRSQLVARKVEGSERTTLDEAELAFHEREYHGLVADLEQARDASFLPDVPPARPVLHDLLARIRRARGTTERAG
jgi:hypothetical protein